MTGAGAQIDVDDHCSREGAEKLARRIQAYWAARSTTVPYVYAEPVFARSNNNPEKRNTHQVRSDLINGMPQRGVP